MNNLEKAIVKEKRAEFVFGVFLIMPAVLTVLSVLWGCFEMHEPIQNDIYGHWYSLVFGEYGNKEFFFVPLMAILGVYLMKGKLRYFYINGENQNTTAQKEEI